MMNRRHLLPMLTALGFGVVLAACGGGEPPPPPPPPPPPTLVSLTLKAAPDVNPDASGAPKPVRVRVYKLKTGQPFAETDFFALDQDPQKALGGDLVGME
jgi:type VI secretion system VasD/TssJ family lipoprotein